MKDLNRFIEAQESNYSIALDEIKNGRKRSHWIWYIFPQLKGLGHSYSSSFYGIADVEEAQSYLNHPILGYRLKEITQALLDLPKELTAREILGRTDALKVKSSLTLFYYVSKDDIFLRVLNRFYNGCQDQNTINIIIQDCMIRLCSSPTSH